MRHNIKIFTITCNVLHLSVNFVSVHCLVDVVKARVPCKRCLRLMLCAWASCLLVPVTYCWQCSRCLIQSPAVDSFTPAIDEIDDVFFDHPNPTSPYVQMRQHPLARFLPSTPGPGGGVLAASAGAGDSLALPAIQGTYDHLTKNHMDVTSGHFHFQSLSVCCILLIHAVAQSGLGRQRYARKRRRRWWRLQTGSRRRRWTKATVVCRSRRWPPTSCRGPRRRRRATAPSWGKYRAVSAAAVHRRSPSRSPRLTQAPPSRSRNRKQTTRLNRRKYCSKSTLPVNTLRVTWTLHLVSAASCQIICLAGSVLTEGSS